MRRGRTLSSEVRSYEGWLEAYGAFQRARAQESNRDAALPADAGWWEEYLREGLEGLPAWEGPREDTDNPAIPAMVAEVEGEAESARTLVADLFGALFAGGDVRTYAGPVERGERQILGPYFVVVVEGRLVRYEGEWTLEDLAGADGVGPEAVHRRLASAVAGWEEGS